VATPAPRPRAYLTFLLITRIASWLRLSRREEAWQTAEILILRHQLAVLQRRQPRRPNVNWADRALLATLLGVIPKARRQGLRLLVTPDTILRWHRDLVRRRWAAQVHARQDRPAGDPPEHQGPGPPAGPGEPRMGVPPDPRRAGRPRRGDSGVDGVGNLKKAGIDPAPRRSGLAWSQFLRSQAEAILARLSAPLACSMAPRPMSWP
jgi:putative transposase